MICLTLTTCKRIDLFQKTLISFYENCVDNNLFTHIIHYDDSSSQEDRLLMFNLLKTLFPNIPLISISFNPTSFTTKKRHLEIMKLWKQNNELFNFDYVFHLEDDWFFEKKFYISEALDLMKNEENIAMVGFSWKKKVFPDNFFNPKIIGNFWEWYYSDNHELNEPLFYDEVEMQYLPNGHWLKIINWPYFGLRPAMHDVNKLKLLGNFNDSTDFFELEFAVRFAKKYKSFLHLDRICYHLGETNSSYSLNNSER